MATHEQVQKNATRPGIYTQDSSEYLQTRPFAPVEQGKQANVQAKGDRASSFVGHSFGNLRVFPPTRKVIQPKLTIGQPGDKYEQEADSVAERVVQNINAPVQASPTQGQSIQRQDVSEDEEIQAKPMAEVIQRQDASEDEVQMKPTTQSPSHQGQRQSSPSLEASIEQARGSGQPLDKSIRQPMEQAFGADFGGVKIHTDAQSDRLNRSINAQAFTTRNDVFFKQGAYNPQSQSGQKLLAHELTHVVQQNGNTVQRQPLLTKIINWFSRRNKPKKKDEGLLANQENQEDIKPLDDVDELDEQSLNALENHLNALENLHTKAEVENVVNAYWSVHKQGSVARENLKANGTLDVNAKAMAGAKLELTTREDDLLKAVEYLVEAEILVEGSFQLKGEAEVKYSNVFIKAKGTLEAFAKATANAKAQFKISKQGIFASGKAEAEASLKANASGDVSIRISSLEAVAKGEASAEAMAIAAAEGAFELSKSGLDISGKAEAFAGVKASASGKLEFKLGRKSIITLSGNASVNLGVGGKVQGTFKIKDGVITIGGGIGTVLGVGASADGEISINYKAIAKAIFGLVTQNYSEYQKKNGYNRLIDDEDLEEKLYQELVDYRNKKAKKGKSGLKADVVQENINVALKKLGITPEQLGDSMFDRAIKKAIGKAFEGILKEVTIENGIIKIFSADSPKPAKK